MNYISIQGDIFILIKNIMMTEINTQRIKQTQSYHCPTMKVVNVNARYVLCLSENESMYEEDFGDGGFSEQ